MTQKENTSTDLITNFRTMISDYRDSNYQIAYDNLNSQLLDDLHMMICLLVGMIGFVLVTNGLSTVLTYISTGGLIQFFVGSVCIFYSGRSISL